ncbi:LysR family transcriptional regulator [Mycolicibacterium smegmatis]|nr:LysR family transcriptional regulator [Mycolicibacterium smegmatis]MBE9628618.1 LysR family transcriptional regulator [Mycolicibacterium smegmatis]MBE9635055.1 LysR family transcriptional regulator [Mycolicibacterium smegmatis]MBE9647249.1 LysR family transcriptional regulator [Mycolicibacterium smegmatis]MBE9653692.1 LysR family transcriptional regulator [Mycolicibacterium smegmatis]
MHTCVMTTLDITVLRTFVAVTAFGGVRRAAQALHLSPAAVSSHVRRLERELGCRLVTAQGRGIGLTIDGEELASRARMILQEHDDTVYALQRPRDDQLVVAASEHAAESLVPTVVSTLSEAYPDHEITLRLNRSERVRQLADDARADVGIMLTRSGHAGVKVAALPLQWFGTETARRDRIVLFARPCAIRDPATASLTGLPYRIVKEAVDLTCLLTAVRQGYGVTPLPRTGPLPEGLRHITDLPGIPSVNLYLTTSSRIDLHVRTALLEALRTAIQ